jgi:hypothetical protein
MLSLNLLNLLLLVLVDELDQRVLVLVHLTFIGFGSAWSARSRSVGYGSRSLAGGGSTRTGFGSYIYYKTGIDAAAYYGTGSAPRRSSHVKADE